MLCLIRKNICSTISALEQDAMHCGIVATSGVREFAAAMLLSFDAVSFRGLNENCVLE